MDYKNGKGVFVSCDHNPQMMLYAIGAYHAYGYLYNITKVSMTIIQPRLENISTFECSVEELLDWAESYVRPRAKLAFEGKPDTLLNRPLKTSAFMPEIKGGNKVMAFGDYSYYWVADRQNRTFRRLNELYARTDQVGFLTTQRVDGKLILPESVQLLQMAAGG